MPLSSQLPRFWLIILVFVVYVHADVFPANILLIGAVVENGGNIRLPSLGPQIRFPHVVDLLLSVKAVHRFSLKCCCCYVMIILLLSSLSRGYLEFILKFSLTG